MLKSFINKDPHVKFLDELLSEDFNKKRLEKLLNSTNIDINYQNSNKETFLHTCIEKRKIKAAIWLLNNHVSVDKTDKNGKTPFDIAIELNQHRVIDKILEISDVDINRKDQFGRSLLQDAVVLGDHEMAKILLEHGANINSKDNKGRHVLYDALSYGNIEFIDYLLTFKNLDLNNVDIEQNTILHHNFVKENDDLAIKFMQHGANPNIKDKEGNTYLSITALKGIESFYIIEEAIKLGFNISARVADENTILIEVISTFSKLSDNDEDRRYSLYLMSKKLIEHGIDINAVNSKNENALFQAVKVGNVDQTAMLLGSGIEVNLQNIYGETALSLAAYGGVEKLDIVSLLLQYNADPTVMDKKGKTLFEVLNEIILSNHDKKKLIDNDILKYALGGTKFIHVLKELLHHNKRELNFLDSTGKPLFFTPLLYNSLPLFKLYTKAGLNLHALTKPLWTESP
ncbi:MAG: ankyrin repeat domain-containing protein [Campylobacterota bacterium]|nr:ankyrin repeat domain-containing protein [Campylobacterota bacterium]